MGAPKFILQGSKNPSTIYVRYSVSRNIDIKVKTNWVINPTEWNSNKGAPKHRNNEKLKFLGDNLDKLKSKIIAEYNQRDDISEITANWLKRIISNSEDASEDVKSVIPKLVIPYIQYYINQKKEIGEVTPNTIKAYTSFKKRILNFQNTEGREFRFKEIDLNFQSKFYQFSQKLNYANNGTNRIMKWLKQVANHAASNRIEISPQLKQISISFQKSVLVYLTQEEINTIANKDMPHDYLDNAKDWLIIGCETGQRVSDYLKFTKSQTFIPPETECDGITFIKFEQTKTGKLMEIPLTDKVMKILEKRDGEFPRQISDVKFNDYIKTVAELAEINTPTRGVLFDKETKRNIVGTYPKHKLITSKVARRSFCTNNYGAKDTIMIMYMSGHTTEKALLDYIGKTDSAKRKLLSTW